MKLSIKEFILLVFAFTLPIKFALSNDSELIYANESFPPWFIQEKDGYHGIDVEILQELARRLDLKLIVNECPWKRCLTQMQKGQIDILSSLFKTSEREAYMHFIEPFYYSAHDTVFYVRRDSSKNLIAYSDLQQMSVGTASGMKYFPRFDQDSKIDKQVVNLQSQLPKMLISYRIDTFLGDETVLDYLVIKAGLENRLQKAPFRVQNTGKGGYIALSKKSRFMKRQKEFSYHLKAMLDDGTIRLIIDNFYAKLRQDNIHTETPN